MVPAAEVWPQRVIITRKVHESGVIITRKVQILARIITRKVRGVLYYPQETARRHTA